eukprot:GHVP01021112.1.p1 GENE.GHVP01021112.1~~GHVP01021112.1.p1  ORF type:complete len:2853 (-),score=396.66 GHVP01021112.1:1761-9332(-)
MAALLVIACHGLVSPKDLFAYDDLNSVNQTHSAFEEKMRLCEECDDLVPMSTFLTQVEESSFYCPNTNTHHHSLAVIRKNETPSPGIGAEFYTDETISWMHPVVCVAHLLWDIRHNYLSCSPNAEELSKKNSNIALILKHEKLIVKTVAYAINNTENFRLRYHEYPLFCPVDGKSNFPYNSNKTSVAEALDYHGSHKELIACMAELITCLITFLSRGIIHLEPVLRLHSNLVDSNSPAICAQNHLALGNVGVWETIANDLVPSFPYQAPLLLELLTSHLSPPRPGHPLPEASLEATRILLQPLDSLMLPPLDTSFAPAGNGLYSLLDNVYVEACLLHAFDIFQSVSGSDLPLLQQKSAWRILSRGSVGSVVRLSSLCEMEALEYPYSSLDPMWKLNPGKTADFVHPGLPLPQEPGSYSIKWNLEEGPDITILQASIFLWASGVSILQVEPNHQFENASFSNIFISTTKLLSKLLAFNPAFRYPICAYLNPKIVSSATDLSLEAIIKPLLNLLDACLRRQNAPDDPILGLLPEVCSILLDLASPISVDEIVKTFDSLSKGMLNNPNVSEASKSLTMSGAFEMFSLLAEKNTELCDLISLLVSFSNSFEKPIEAYPVTLRFIYLINSFSSNIPMELSSQELLRREKSRVEEFLMRLNFVALSYNKTSLKNSTFVFSAHPGSNLEDDTLLSTWELINSFCTENILKRLGEFDPINKHQRYSIIGACLQHLESMMYPLHIATQGTPTPWILSICNSVLNAIAVGNILELLLEVVTLEYTLREKIEGKNKDTLFIIHPILTREAFESSFFVDVFEAPVVSGSNSSFVFAGLHSFIAISKVLPSSTPWPTTNQALIKASFDTYNRNFVPESKFNPMDLSDNTNGPTLSNAFYLVETLCHCFRTFYRLCSPFVENSPQSTTIPLTLPSQILSRLQKGILEMSTGSQKDLVYGNRLFLKSNFLFLGSAHDPLYSTDRQYLLNRTHHQISPVSLPTSMFFLSTHWDSPSATPSVTIAGASLFSSMLSFLGPALPNSERSLQILLLKSVSRKPLNRRRILDLLIIRSIRRLYADLWIGMVSNYDQLPLVRTTIADLIVNSMRTQPTLFLSGLDLMLENIEVDNISSETLGDSTSILKTSITKSVEHGMSIISICADCMENSSKSQASMLLGNLDILVYGTELLLAIWHGDKSCFFPKIIEEKNLWDFLIKTTEKITSYLLSLRKIQQISNSKLPKKQSIGPDLKYCAYLGTTLGGLGAKMSCLEIPTAAAEENSDTDVFFLTSIATLKSGHALLNIIKLVLLQLNSMYSVLTQQEVAATMENQEKNAQKPTSIPRISLRNSVPKDFLKFLRFFSEDENFLDLAYPYQNSSSATSSNAAVPIIKHMPSHGPRIQNIFSQFSALPVIRQHPDSSDVFGSEKSLSSKFDSFEKSKISTSQIECSNTAGIASLDTFFGSLVQKTLSGFLFGVLGGPFTFESAFSGPMSDIVSWRARQSTHLLDAWGPSFRIDIRGDQDLASYSKYRDGVVKSLLESSFFFSIALCSIITKSSRARLIPVWDTTSNVPFFYPHIPLVFDSLSQIQPSNIKFMNLDHLFVLFWLTTELLYLSWESNARASCPPVMDYQEKVASHLSFVSPRRRPSTGTATPDDNSSLGVQSQNTPTIASIPSEDLLNLPILRFENFPTSDDECSSFVTTTAPICNPSIIRAHEKFHPSDAKFNKNPTLGGSIPFPAFEIYDVLGLPQDARRKIFLVLQKVIDIMRAILEQTRPLEQSRRTEEKSFPSIVAVPSKAPYSSYTRSGGTSAFPFRGNQDTPASARITPLVTSSTSKRTHTSPPPVSPTNLMKNLKDSDSSFMSSSKRLSISAVDADETININMESSLCILGANHLISQLIRMFVLNTADNSAPGTPDRKNASESSESIVDNLLSIKSLLLHTSLSWETAVYKTIKDTSVSFEEMTATYGLALTIFARSPISFVRGNMSLVDQCILLQKIKYGDDHMFNSDSKSTIDLACQKWRKQQIEKLLSHIDVQVRLAEFFNFVKFVIFASYHNPEVTMESIRETQRKKSIAPWDFKKQTISVALFAVGKPVRPLHFDIDSYVLNHMMQYVIGGLTSSLKSMMEDPIPISEDDQLLETAFDVLFKFGKMAPISQFIKAHNDYLLADLNVATSSPFFRPLYQTLPVASVNIGETRVYLETTEYRNLRISDSAIRSPFHVTLCCYLYLLNLVSVASRTSPRFPTLNAAFLRIFEGIVPRLRFVSQHFFVLGQLGYLEEYYLLLRLVREIPKTFSENSSENEQLKISLLSWVVEAEAQMQKALFASLSQGYNLTDSISPQSFHEKVSAGIPFLATSLQSTSGSTASIFQQRILLLMILSAKSFVSCVVNLAPLRASHEESAEVILRVSRTIQEYADELMRSDRKSLLALRTKSDNCYLPLSVWLRPSVVVKGPRPILNSLETGTPQTPTQSVTTTDFTPKRRAGKLYQEGHVCYVGRMSRSPNTVWDPTVEILLPEMISLKSFYSILKSTADFGIEAAELLL